MDVCSSPLANVFQSEHLFAPLQRLTSAWIHASRAEVARLELNESASAKTLSASSGSCARLRTTRGSDLVAVVHLIQPLECRVPFAVAEVGYYAYGADVGSGSVVDANPTTENKVLGPGAASGSASVVRSRQRHRTLTQTSSL